MMFKSPFLFWKLKVCGHAATPPVGPPMEGHWVPTGIAGKDGNVGRPAPSRTIYKDEVIRRRVQLPAARLLPTWRTVAPIRHTGPDLDLIHDPGPSAKPSRAALPP